jgi:hypothetical protein
LVLTMPTAKTEADLLELMRADRVTLDERLVVQTAVDLEATKEHIAPARIARVSRRDKPCRT